MDKYYGIRRATVTVTPKSKKAEPRKKHNVILLLTITVVAVALYFAVENAEFIAEALKTAADKLW